MSMRPVEFLLVDDEPGDVLLAREAIHEARLTNHLHVAPDGEKALAFLHESECVDLILLDLNMPRKGGRELLAEIKADPRLARLPVVIVTGSEVEGEILKAYNLEVSCYITKPINVTQLMKAVRSIPHFKVTVVTDEVVTEGA